METIYINKKYTGEIKGEDVQEVLNYKDEVRVVVKTTEDGFEGDEIELIFREMVGGWVGFYKNYEVIHIPSILTMFNAPTNEELYKIRKEEKENGRYNGFDN